MSWFKQQAPPQGETPPWAQALVQQKQGALGQLGQGGNSIDDAIRRMPPGGYPIDPNAPPQATDQGPEGWGWGMGGHEYWKKQHPGVPEQYPNGPWQQGTGGGQVNTPQPVPGGGPRPFDPGMGSQPPMTGIDWDQHIIGTRPGEPGFDPNKGFNQILYPGGQMPAIPPGYSKGTGMPMMGPDPTMPTAQTGALAALGGGMAPQLNQSGMVTLRSPDGRETQQVSAQDAAHWLSRGAVRA